jgi:hypothetical protein
VSYHRKNHKWTNCTVWSHQMYRPSWWGEFLTSLCCVKCGFGRWFRMGY